MGRWIKKAGTQLSPMRKGHMGFSFSCPLPYLLWHHSFITGLIHPSERSILCQLILDPIRQYGSDIIVDLLETLGIGYTAFNPGASFRDPRLDMGKHRGRKGIVEVIDQDVVVKDAHLAYILRVSRSHSARLRSISASISSSVFP